MKKKMKVLIPVDHLIAEDIIKLHKSILIPGILIDGDENIEDTEVDSTPNSSLSEEIEVIKKLWSDNNDDSILANSSLLVFDYLVDLDKYNNSVPVDDFIYLEELCLEADKILDYIRLSYCQIGKQELLPGIPGIISGFRYGAIIDTKNKIFRRILGRVHSYYSKPGIGLLMDPINNNLRESTLYKCLFDERDDEVYLKIRNGLRRINEAMYMGNINTSFIYLMSTFDMLASDEYINFKKVKSRIIPFLVNSKKSYHNKSKFFKYLSKDIRTEIVHNGKSLFNFFNSKEELIHFMFRITSLIVNYCTEVYKSGVRTDLQLENEIEKRRMEIGI